MSKESFINNLSDETIINMIDRTYKYEKTKQNKSVTKNLLKMIPAVAAIALVISLVRFLPVMNSNTGENSESDGNGDGINAGSATVLKNTDAPAITEKKPELKENIYDRDGVTFADYSLCEYDENGNLIKETFYRDEYEYDENGNMVKQIVYNADGSTESWRDFKYDENGVLIYIFVYNADPIRLTKIIYYNTDGSVNYWEELEYDEDGKQVKRTRYDENGVIQSWTEYDENNEFGGIIKYTVYNPDGSIRWWVEIEDDDPIEYEDRIFRIIKQETFYSADGSLIAWREPKYEHDESGIYSGIYIGATHYDADGNIISGINYIGATHYDADGNIIDEYEFTNLLENQKK